MHTIWEVLECPTENIISTFSSIESTFPDLILMVIKLQQPHIIYIYIYIHVHSDAISYMGSSGCS